MPGDTLRFLAFADLHHHPGAFKTDAPERLAAIRYRAESVQVDFAVHLGDFCHAPSRSAELLAQYDAFPCPVFHLAGNHDSDETPRTEMLRLYRLPATGYTYDDVGGFRLIRLDTNFYRKGETYIPYDLGSHFKLPLQLEEINWIPPEQLTWLREAVLSSPHPCVLLSHCSLEREVDGVRNRDAVQAIIREAYGMPGRVLLCIAGHHHRDYLRIFENTAFFELNSAAFDWLPTPHRLFPEEWYAEFRHMGNMAIFRDALSTVVTLHSDGEIEIEGMTSSMLCGVTREMTDNPRCDGDGRPCTAQVLSARFRLL